MSEKSDFFERLDFTSDDIQGELTDSFEQVHYPHFGKFMLAPGLVQCTPFQAGEEIVFDMLPKDPQTGEYPSARGYKQGGRHKLMLMLRQDETKDGDPYQRSYTYDSVRRIETTKDDFDKHPECVLQSLSDQQKAALEKDGKTYLATWFNLQAPALRASVKKQKWAGQKLTDGEWVYAKALLYNTGEPPYESKTAIDDEGKPRKIYKQYYGEFTFYKTKDEMTAARDEYWAQRSGESVAKSNKQYPKTWEADPQSMIQYCKDLAEQGKSHAEIAKTAMIITDDGPAEAIGGGTVDPRALLSQILDLPEPMIEVGETVDLGEKAF